MWTWAQQETAHSDPPAVLELAIPISEFSSEFIERVDVIQAMDAKYGDRDNHALEIEWNSREHEWRLVPNITVPGDRGLHGARVAIAAE